MANATLFDHNIQVNDTQLIPEPTDEFSYGWGTQIAEQQVRALGIAGSVVFLVPGFPNGQEYEVQSESITLPIWYGSTWPPMVFAMPQYGSIVVFKQIEDRLNRTIDGQHNPPIFRTWVSHLVHNGTQWSFKVNHHHRPSSMVIPVFDSYKAPFRWLNTQWMPKVNPFQALEGLVATHFAIHWYALGADANYGSFSE